MPIWIKAILFVWAITFVGVIYLRFWAMADSNIPRVIRKDYPIWVPAVGVLILLDVFSVIPIFFWLIFLR